MAGKSVPAPAPAQPPPPPPPPVPSAKPGGDPKAAILAAIREQNKVFYSMFVAQAQQIEIEGDSIVFTFAAAHKTLRSQLENKRAWIEQVAQSATGRRLTVVIRELPPVAQAADDPAKTRRADLEARAKAEPAVQAVLDVFGGEIEDIEEL